MKGDASYNNNTLMGNVDMSGITKRRGMTTSIISAFPKTNMMNDMATDAKVKQGTLFGSVLTILAIMIGTGVIGIPYAVYKLSISLGLAILITYIPLAMLSLDLIYESSRLTGWKSLSEIGFYCLGKPSVYIINLVVFAKSAGMPIIYFILTGTWCSNIMTKIGGVPEELQKNYPWVLIASALLFYFILKKDISSLKPISFFLFLGVLLFIVLLTFHMIKKQDDWNGDNKHSGYYSPTNEKKSKLRLIYWAETILVGLTFTTVFFPVLNNLKDDSKTGIMKTSFVALCTASTIYISVWFVSIYAFGHKIHSDILKNVGDNDGWETYILGALFAVVGALHIPLIFYVGKEALLIIIFTLFYTHSEEKQGDLGETSHLENTQNIGISNYPRNQPGNLTQNEMSRNDVATRSELNRTNNRSFLK